MTKKQLIDRLAFSAGWNAVRRQYCPPTPVPRFLRLRSVDLTPALWRFYVEVCRDAVCLARQSNAADSARQAQAHREPGRV